jgi:hypothetical protein
MTRIIVAALLATVSAGAAVAEEGMWLPSQTGAIADQLRTAGLQLDPARLGNLQQPPLTAIASLGGCSAAFLSPQGLVATNHHCVYGSIQYNSKPGQDYLTNGFLAAGLGDELPAAPGSRIYVIEDLRNVTADMMKGATSLTGRARYDRLETNRKALIAACEKQASRRCDVRPYFGGQSYWLQQQLEIKDVRLVYAPASGIGNFGGETDNWMWPRHTGDFGFYRAYVAPDGSSAPFAKENVPFKPKAFLKIAEQGVKDGDFVMVAGFPGITFRHKTAAEAKFAFQTLTPLQQRLLNDYSDTIDRAVAGNEEGAIKYASILAGVDNYKKKYVGELAGADAMGLIAKKEADEAAFRAWVAGDAKRQAQYGAAIVDLDRLVAAQNAAELAEARRGLLNRAQLFSAARQAYRFAREREKPDAQREPGYQDRDRAFLEQRLTAIERRFDPKIDQAIWEAALQEYRTLATPERHASFDAAVPQTIGGVYAGTELADTQKRLAWLSQPAAAFQTSTDPFVRLAVASYDEDLRREGERKAREGDLQRARSAYMAARLAYAESQGKTLYPDANGSLRFTQGKVTGKARDGLTWTPFTTAEGLAAKHTGKGEFDAPDKMIQLIAAKDYGSYASSELGTLPVDFLSTVDITNGNSGSSTLNARGEFVGLAFDGTLEGVVSDWMYNPAVNRTIHVDSRFMLWTMDKVDGAHRLLDEMGVRR